MLSSFTSLRGSLPSFLMNTAPRHANKIQLTQASLNYTTFKGDFTAIDTDGTGQYVAVTTVEETAYYSTDFGQTFSPTIGCSVKDLLAVNVANNASYVLFGGQSGLHLSTNYGKTCTTIIDLSDGNIHHYNYQEFVSVSMSDDGQYGYAAMSSNTYLYFSDDYCQTFKLMSSPAFMDTYNAVTTSSTGQYVYALGSTSYYRSFYSSSNYGVSWTKSTFVYGTSIATSSDGSYVVIASPDGYCVSSDYGVTFGKFIQTDIYSFPSTVSMSSTGQYMVFADTDSVVYLSSDYGKTINMTNSGARAWNSAAVSSSGQYYYAVANGDYIFQSTDYGVTWSPNYFYWIDVATSLDGQISYAITSFQTFNFVYRTTNSGKTWEMLDNLFDYQYTAIACDANCTNIALVADQTYLYLSNNSGSSWEFKHVINAASVVIKDVSMSQSGQYMVFCTDFAGIYYSKNYGATWGFSNANIGFSWVALSSSSSGQYVNVVSDYGYIYYSNDYGVTWTTSTVPASYFHWKSISSDSTGKYAIATVGAGGVIYYSQDYAYTWTASQVPANNWVASALSSQGNIGYAVIGAGPYSYDNTGSIYISNDYGVTWKISSSPVLRWDSIDCDSSGQFVVASVYNGPVYTSSDFGSTWMVSNITITSYNLYNVSSQPISTHSSTSSAPLSAGAIAGIAIGSIVFLIALVIVFLFLGIIPSNYFVEKKEPMANDVQM